MKRLFILASAAIVALAACTKTEVVYKDALEQIAFKQITHVMTKTDPALSPSLDLGVLAHQGTSVYFTDTQFSHDGSTNWTNNSKYWPYEGTLDFTVYAPYNGNAEYVPTTSKLTIPDVVPSADLYYGVQRYVETSNVSAVPVALKHACAKIVVNLTPGTLYTVTGLTFDGVNTAGDVVVSYTNPVSVSTEGATTGAKSCTLTDTDLDIDGLNLAPIYVLPGNQTSFTISFTQENGNYDVSFSKTISLAGTDVVWAANTAYTYNISISNPNTISFYATVNDWTSTNPVDKTVQ